MAGKANRGGYEGRGGDLLLVALLVLGIVAVGGVGPERLTRWMAGEPLSVAASASRTPPAAVRSEEAIPHTAVGREVAQSITPAAVSATLERFAGMRPRIPGYGGATQAAEEIRARFVEMGLSRVTVDTFRVTVPVDRGGSLRVDETGEEFPLHALWPNGVRTSTTPATGLGGPLVDGGHGAFAEFDGRRIRGSVVLMGFGCGMDYLNARALGAQAIVFYDDGYVSRQEAMAKFIRVPADVPRYWVEPDAARRLRALAAAGSPRVTLDSRMDWETVPAYNVYARLQGAPGRREGTGGGSGEVGNTPGERWNDDPIVLSAYYDAMSVVPALARGAENACSITALLQVAAYLEQHPPSYPVVFLATSAHFLGLSGVNDFLYRHARRSEYFRTRMARPLDFRLFIGLDLSSHDDEVAAFSQGTFYTGWQTDRYVKNLMTPYARRFATYVEAAYPHSRGSPRYVDAVAPSRQTWKDFMPVGLALDSEAATFVGLSGITLATPNDLRRRVDTPADVVANLDVESLTRQIRTLAALLGAATRDPHLFTDTALQLKDKGHALGGQVYWFNRDVNFAVPQDPISGAVVTYQQKGFDSIAGVRTLMTTRTDTSGRFRFDILRNASSNRVLAYKMDDEGRITWAPDLGNEGDAAFPITQKYVWWEDEMVEVLFPCRSLTLLQTVDARRLVALDQPTILGENDAPLQWYGEDHIADQSKVQGDVALATVIYARPDTRVKVLMSTGLVGVKYLLTNSPDHFLAEPITPAQASPGALVEAKGRGIPVDWGLVPHPLLRSTTDMWVINDVRMKILERYGVRNERMGRLHAASRQALITARTALDHLRYGEYIAALRKAAGFESRAYPDVKATANDTVNGIIFYFVLLLPFAFFMERLVFGFPDIRHQLAAFLGIFLLVFLVLHLVHPAFKLSTSPYIVLLAFVILAMGTAVIALILSKFKAEMQAMRRRAEGVYEADVGRLSATMAAVMLGISNLRKRPLRTWLTAITLVLVSFTALSFTSIRSTIEYYRLPRSNAAPYSGALIRDRSWRGLQPVALEYVRSAFADRATVAPRAWFLLPEAQGRAQIACFDPATGRSVLAYGIVGMSPQETRVQNVDALLLPGGRWFAPGETDVCILPADMAALMGIGATDVGRARIRLLGAEYTVIGLLDARRLNRVTDLDAEKMTPVDMVTESSVATTSTQETDATPTAPIRSFVHLEASNIVLLPYAETLQIGGTLRSIAIADYQGDLSRAIESFVTRISLPVFVGDRGRVTVYSSLGSASFSGMRNLAVPLLIAALIILNTMMGSVYERVNEIGIYSSLGLTPLHVGALFVAEASVFATLGAVLGYLVGQTLAMALSHLGWMEGITLNYSSLTAISSTLIVMVTVFLSTLYPAKKAADMTVPDVTRKWSFNEPEGDVWRFDFPFTVAGAEILALYAYLMQVFRSYGEGSIGEFLTEDALFSVRGSGAQARYRIDLRAWLAPYDLGIAQEVRMDAIPTGDHDIYRIAMEIRRLSGDVESWKRINRGFLNVLRKRFLVWRTVPPSVRSQYASAGTQMVEQALD